METTLHRIKQYIDYKGITNQKYEQTVGFSNGGFATQLKNNKTIGSDKLENTLNSYPDLSAEWLLTGIGEMIKKYSDSSDINNSNTLSEPDTLYLNNNIVADYVIENTDELLKNKKFATWYNNIILKAQVETLKEALTKK